MKVEFYLFELYSHYFFTQKSPCNKSQEKVSQYLQYEKKNQLHQIIPRDFKIMFAE